MIGFLRGEIAEITETLLIIDVNGVGYNVFIHADMAASMPSVGTQVKVYTYTHVKEDAFSLYGFRNRDELDFFKLLIGVNGIGPKGALGILSVLRPDDLRFAIFAGDTKTLSKAPGVGKKTAERMVLDLKDKISLEDTLSKDESIRPDNVSEAGNGDKQLKQDAVEALIALGYAPADSLKAVNKVPLEARTTSEDILKQALKYLL